MTNETPAEGGIAPQRSAQIRDFDSRVGVTQPARDRSICLTIANDELLPGTELLLISPERPQRLTNARVGGRRDRPCTEPGDEWGSVEIANAAFYKVEVPGDTVRGSLSIAVVGPVPPFAVRGDAITADLDGDGREEVFEECASNEGIHLSINTPGVGAGGRRWHQYFYVPYALEPNCPGVSG